MSDTDLRDLLHDQRQHEPAFLLDPASTIRTGRRRRHLRSGVAAVAVAGVLGAVGVLALPGGSDVTVRPAPAGGGVATPPPPTSDNPDQPLADYVSSLAASAYAGVPGAREPDLRIVSPAGEVAADDPTAQSFLAQVDARERVLLVVRLGRPADGVGPDDMCETSSDLYLSCEDSVRADGSYVLETVGRTSAPGADGTFRMYPPIDKSGVVASEVYFRRTVVLETPDGNVTAVDEFTRATTLAEAEGEWVLSAQELADLAADPGLAAYDLPHEAWR